MDGGYEDRRVRKTPETLRLRAIQPALRVADLQVSLSWYCDVMGFTLAESWERDGSVAGVALIAGSERLMLEQAGGAEGVGGAGHMIRLSLETVQDIDALAEGVEARGGRIHSGPGELEHGVRGFSLIDPDGVHLTIVSRS